MLNVSNLGFLDKPLKEFLDVFVFMENINQVSSITIEIDDDVLFCEIFTDDEDKNNDVFIVNGVDVSNIMDDKNRTQVFRYFYQALIGLTLYDLDLEQPTEFAEPDVVITYRFKDDARDGAVYPSEMKIELIPKDDRMYYAVRNGEYEGILVEIRSLDKADGLRDSFNKLRGAMDAE
ncbi:MAG: hypothetical protein FWH55_01925 [Oscillospiraceae bacterium]|nr:hypothetical protein [Oscillospiraceae bacterium]